MKMSPNGEYFCVGSYGYFRKTDQALTSIAYLEDSDPATDFTTDDAGNIAWCCTESSSLIREYHYPSGAVARTFPVYGSPLHMVYRNHSVIVATQASAGSESCVEVIGVDK